MRLKTTIPKIGGESCGEQGSREGLVHCGGLPGGQLHVEVQRRDHSDTGWTLVLMLIEEPWQHWQYWEVTPVRLELFE